MPNEQWRCAECNFRTENRRAYLNHFEVHMNLNIFACEMCDSKFVDAKRRNEHLEEEHKMCSNCDFQGKVSVKRACLIM